MKKINFFDGAESSTEPTIGNISASHLVTYANDAAYEAVNGPGVAGSIYYNTTLNVKRYYDVDAAAWKSDLEAPIDAEDIADGSVDNTEFQQLDGVTSNIQDQLDQNAQDISDHIADTSDAHDASAISNIPSGNLAATDQQTVNNELQSDIDSRIPNAEKGAAGGVATLDGGGKVPVAQLPNSIMEYQGTWNATTNTPTLADGVGNTGDVYRVAVAGTQDLGSGNITFDVGDYVIYNTLGAWEKSDTTDAVATVNGMTGNVTVNAINELTGDVVATPATGSQSKSTTIQPNVVSYSKMQDIPTDSLIGRDTASTGDPETIGLNATLEMDGANNLQRAALTGDVTSSAGSNATTIAPNVVDNSKLADMATQTIKGRTTGDTGDPEDLTATQATAILNPVVGDSGSGGTKGLVPAPAAGDAAANKFLHADGTFQTPSVASASEQSQIFTSSGSFNVPASVTEVTISGIGGGGGGGGGGGAGGFGGGGGAGGGGAIYEEYKQTVTPSDTLTVTIGAGGSAGAGGAGSGSTGGTGGSTTITGTGVNLTLFGSGGGGGGGGNGATGGTGGVSPYANGGTGGTGVGGSGGGGGGAGASKKDGGDGGVAAAAGSGGAGVFGSGGGGDGGGIGATGSGGIGGRSEFTASTSTAGTTGGTSAPGGGGGGGGSSLAVGGNGGNGANSPVAGTAAAANSGAGGGGGGGRGNGGGAGSGATGGAGGSGWLKITWIA